MVGRRRDRVAPETVGVPVGRLANTPVVVYDATWRLVLANAPYDALMGETSTWRGIERNAVWRDLAIVLGTQTLVE